MSPSSPSSAGAGLDSRPGPFTTGLPNVDTLLGGGIPPGSLVTLTAEAHTSAELLCEAFVGESPQPATYLSTARNAQTVRESIDRQERVSDFATIESSDDTPRQFITLAPRTLAQTDLPPLPEPATPSAIPATAKDDLGLGSEPYTTVGEKAAHPPVMIPASDDPFSTLLQWAGSHTSPVIAVDAFTDLAETGKTSAGQERWQLALNWLYNLAHETDGVVLLLCTRVEGASPTHAEQQATRLADGVFRYESSLKNATDTLYVTRMRGFRGREQDDGLPAKKALEVTDYISASPTESY